ncbi:hypothetical protein AB0A74_35825 [Saccharothrix sp. NPDC042600]|uniref:hypothetical protein n=1 Tax=Saccharothrix TaxID=2071 RepID=UPI003407330A|nr:hypothetical protein GCM10017745_43320 [Saccharothrix mutabilis subsp. capreolus]
MTRSPSGRTRMMFAEDIGKVMDEIHKRELAAPDRARTHAQLGVGIVGAAVVAFGAAVGGLDLLAEPLWLLMLGVVALVVLGLSVSLFIMASATRPPGIEHQPDLSQEEEVNLHLDRAAEEAWRVRCRANQGLKLAGFGLVLAGATTALAPEYDREAAFQVVLTREGANVLTDLCEAAVRARITVVADGEDDMVTDPAKFTVVDPGCAEREVSMPQRLISGFHAKE